MILTCACCGDKFECATHGPLVKYNLLEDQLVGVEIVYSFESAWHLGSGIVLPVPLFRPPDSLPAAGTNVVASPGCSVCYPAGSGRSRELSTSLCATGARSLCQIESNDGGGERLQTYYCGQPAKTPIFLSHDCSFRQPQVDAGSL